MPAFPITRYLVPAEPPSVTDDFTRIKQPIVRGIPATIPLDAKLDVALVVPTGVARIWTELDPGAVVLDSAADEQAQPPARLVVRSSGAILGTVPLVGGLRRHVPDAGVATDGAVLLWILGFRIHAGTVVGPGDYGSFVEVAWRRPDDGPPFALPPLPEGVAARFVLQALHEEKVL